MDTSGERFRRTRVLRASQRLPRVRGDGERDTDGGALAGLALQRECSREPGPTLPILLARLRSPRKKEYPAVTSPGLAIMETSPCRW